MALKQAFSTVDGVTDLLYVATNLNIAIPEQFTPTYGAMPAAPTSLNDMFGEPSEYEFKGLFMHYYNQDTNTWDPAATPDVVSDAIKAAVADQFVLIREYDDITLPAWQLGYYKARETQWRKSIAQDLIDLCAAP